MPAPWRISLTAFALPAMLALPAAAAGNGVVERPAPTNPVIAGKPAPLRPSQAFVAALNAIIAAQLAAQDQASEAGSHKIPRPRPDREHLVRAAGLPG